MACSLAPAIAIKVAAVARRLCPENLVGSGLLSQAAISRIFVPNDSNALIGHFAATNLHEVSRMRNSVIASLAQRFELLMTNLYIFY